MKTKKKTTKKPEKKDKWSECIGKSTLLRIDWEDWKKKQPENGQDIVVVVKDCDGTYAPVHATYLVEHFKETVDKETKKKIPAITFRIVEFREFTLGRIFLGSKEEKHLVAWGCLKSVVKLGKECGICKRIDCIC